MPQLRQNPVTGRWVAIATERAKRPTSFTRAAGVAVPAASTCPFCYGNESMTPPEVMAYRPTGTAENTEGWEVRVVPNLYPAFGPANGEPTVATVGMYQTMNGAGVHEVIVSSPLHAADISELPTEKVRRIVDMYIDRYNANRNNPSVQYLLLINNHGKEAGASLEHPHSQLFGIPLVPSEVEDELAGIQRYRNEQGRCVYCDVNANEEKDGERIIAKNEWFLTFAPFASRTPFEASIVPRWHAPRFEEMNPDQREAFANALHDLLTRFRVGLNDPPLNFFIHTAPCHADGNVDYHWHLELLPKLAIAAGFELGSGVMINVATPESAAEFLRNVDLSGESQPIAVPSGHH